MNANDLDMKIRITDLEKENEELRQLVNATGTIIIIEQARRETGVKKLSDTFEKMVFTKEFPVCTMERSERYISIPTFFGNTRDPHPKRFLTEVEKYLTVRKIGEEDKMIVIENMLKGKAAQWYSMMKYASPNVEKFKDLFLNQYFSESHQWEIFIQCTEAGKKTVRTGFQEHFHHWMIQLKHLNMPKMKEEQATNLFIKHFPISIQAYVQNCTEKSSYQYGRSWER